MVYASESQANESEADVPAGAIGLADSWLVSATSWPRRSSGRRGQSCDWEWMK